MVNRLEVSRDIEAPPAEIYAAISDVTRMGEWSEECYACEWREGFDGPVVGATFDGHNRYGDHEWTTQGRVIEADPGRAFAFECSMMDFHYSTWGRPTTAGRLGRAGSTVTEWSEDLRPESVLEFSKQVSGRGVRFRAALEAPTDGPKVHELQRLHRLKGARVLKRSTDTRKSG